MSYSEEVQVKLAGLLAPIIEKIIEISPEICDLIVAEAKRVKNVQ